MNMQKINQNKWDIVLDVDCRLESHATEINTTSNTG
jgi:hypothetical protein